MKTTDIADCLLRRLSPGHVPAGTNALCGHAFWQPYIESGLLGVALCHVSALADTDDDRARCDVELLGFIAKGFLEVISYHHLFVLLPEFEDRLRQDAAIHIRTAILDWVIDSLNLRERAVFGKGLAAAEQSSPKILVRIATQVIAAIYLRAGYEEVFAATSDVAGFAVKSISRALLDYNPKARLQSYAQAHGSLPKFEVISSDGPQHSQSFTCAVSLLGRKTEGNGRSKKAAEMAAAELYLKLYGSKNTSKNLGTQRLSRTPVRNNAVHLDADIVTINRIAQRFNVSETFLPLVQRAMTTRALADEALTGAALAQLGAHVIGLIVRLSIVEELLCRSDSERERSPALFSGYMLKTDQVAQMWKLLPFETALVRPKKFDVTDATRADVVQAVFGAALVAHRTFEALVQGLPQMITDWISGQTRSAIQITEPVFQPKSGLQDWCQACGIEPAYAIEASGPNHGRQYRCTLTLRSPHLADQYSVRGSNESSKGSAEGKAASLLLSLIVDANRDLSDKHAKLGRPLRHWIFDHIIKRLQTEQYQSRKWAELGVLGVDHLKRQDARAFWDWGVRASQLVPIVAIDPSCQAALKYYKSVRPFFPGTLAGLADSIATAVRSVQGLSPESSTDQISATIQQLLELSKIIDLSTRRPTITRLHTVEQDLRALRILSGNVSIRGESSASFIHLQDILPFLIREVLLYAVGQDRSASITAIEMRPDQTSKLEMQIAFSEAMAHPAPTASLSGLWAYLFRAVPILECERSGATLRLVLGLAFEHDCIFPAHAQIAFLSGETEDESRFMTAVSRVLHDMKNSLIACRTCISTPGQSRTSQLRSAYEASAQLDNATALANSLASLTVSPDQQESVCDFDFSDFMKAYALSLLATLPERVRLIPPAAHPKTLLSSHQQILRAILDNLVRNALDAMPDGGDLTVDWLHSDVDHVLLIEISDTGRGMPTEVMNSMLKGQIVGSTKRSGSGIGMLSVTAMLKRIGGSIAGNTAPGKGTFWTVSIPNLQDHNLSEQ